MCNVLSVIGGLRAQQKALVFFDRQHNGGEGVPYLSHMQYGLQRIVCDVRPRHAFDEQAELIRARCHSDLQRGSAQKIMRVKKRRNVLDFLLSKLVACALGLEHERAPIC